LATEDGLNYRHAFHAGNFADLVKHAALALVLDRLLAAPEPLLVIDTHAGAGLYDLKGEMARKSGEAEAGVVRLMADSGAPAAFDELKDQVRRLNGYGEARLYPGSPVQVAERLRPGDAYVGAELQPDDFEALAAALEPYGGKARAVQSDGYALAETLAGQDRRRLFVLIDPPFERADDYGRAADLIGSLLRRKRPAIILLWTPIKDLETFDALVRRLESVRLGSLLVAEARLNGLENPMRLNGCGLIFANEPSGLSESLQPLLNWVVASVGSPKAVAKLWRPEPA
jgi:23S rRNA (adenine2030-N6)-methyltransferase